MRSRAFLVAWLLALASPSVAYGQLVPGKEHAKRLFDEGVELEKRTDYAAALAKYREAEQITITPGLRFHKGYCLEMTSKLSLALEEYEAADRMAREQNKQDVHAATIARLEPLRSRVPQIAIRLTTADTDAEVMVDGAIVGTPLLDGKAFRIDPGDHIVSAKAPSRRSFSRSVHVAESVTTTVDVALDPEPSVGAAPLARPTLTEPPREPAPRRSLALPIATTAGAVALATGGLVAFVVAANASSDARHVCPTKLDCEDERSRVRTFDALALAGFGSAVGLAVVSVLLWAAPPATRTSGSARRAEAPRIVARPAVLGVGVEGSFE